MAIASARPAGLLLLLLTALVSCGVGDEASSRALTELEGLAFLPPGRCLRMGVDEPECSTDVALLVDLFEVSRGDWRRFLAEAGAGPRIRRAQAGPGEAGERERSPGADATWPATFMTLEEARAFASWRGMRLLSAGEWVLAAAGPLLHSYPWGDIPQTSVANTLDLALGRLVSGGTFDAGRTPLGCHDFCGNVWEWVEGTIGVDEGSEGSWAKAWAMGGSYQSWIRPIYQRDQGFHAQRLDPGTRARDLGLRCAIEAEPYLRARIGQLEAGPSARKKLRAIGRRWGRSSLPVLERIAAELGGSPGLEALIEGARS